MYILSIIRNIFSVLTRQQKIKLVVLLTFFLFSALLQIVGVASIAPFITILSNQEIIQKNDVLSYLYKTFEAESNSEFIMGFAIVSLTLIVISNTASAFTLWLLLKFSVNVGCDLQCRLFNNFLKREFIFHKTANYNKSISIIAHETPRFVYMVLQPFLLLASQICIAILILVGLLIINPFIALASGLIIGGAYLMTYVFLRKSLVYHGNVMTERNDRMQSILSEAFIGIKDIKLNTLEEKYLKSFYTVNYKGLNSAAYIVLSGDLPKFVIETISFGAILLLAMILLLSSESSEGIISILSIYALAGYKLLPTMQQVYKSVSSMSGNGSVTADIRRELTHHIQNNSNSVKGRVIPNIKTIELKGIEYQYPNTEDSTLQAINIAFNRGNLNTIAGPSGSGKSTLSDVMLGLLPATTGHIELDGEKLTGQLMSDYQRSVGYVPQSIFILDGSVIANVAFGVSENEVNIEKVHQALKMANASEFVDRLPNGIYTELGQDGKLLSGGQRQRIGIARALYRNSSVLILDEPTSALDIESEYELMKLLGTLKEQVLIIVISHRPAAIKLSDTITLMNDGKIVASASYQKLRATNPEFRELLEKSMMD